MLKKSLSSVFVLLLISLVSAEEVIGSEQTQFSPTSYILLFSILLFLIIIIGLIIFFIKRLKYNFNKVLKSVGISLLITFIIEVLFYVIGSLLGWFMISCELGIENCPGSFDIFIASFPFTAIPIFFVTILIYYIVQFVKRKKK